jgi:deazaflavin-dependent oxidoreductase (nitroreductase family)
MRRHRSILGLDRPAAQPETWSPGLDIGGGMSVGRAVGRAATRIARVPIPERVARFNRRVTNPIARLVAGWLPPFALVEHVGRTSGRTYRTPVWAFSRDRGLVVALTYGAATDWVRNVLASGGTTVERLGVSRRYADSRILLGADGMDLMPRVVRPALRAFGVDAFLVLRRIGAP